MIVRRIEPVSLARVTAIIYAFIGLVAALPAGCAMTLVGSLTDDVPAMFGGLGLVVVLIYPIAFGLMGLVGGLLTAIVYNFVAGRFGGVEIEVEETMP
jgi:hypothetical protein